MIFVRRNTLLNALFVLLMAVSVAALLFVVVSVYQLLTQQTPVAVTDDYVPPTSVIRFDFDDPPQYLEVNQKYWIDPEDGDVELFRPVGMEANLLGNVQVKILRDDPVVHFKSQGEFFTDLETGSVPGWISLVRSHDILVVAIEVRPNGVYLPTRVKE